MGPLPNIKPHVCTRGMDKGFDARGQWHPK